MQRLLAMLRARILHFFRVTEFRGVMLESAEDCLAVGQVASGVQDMRVPDIINVLGGNKVRLRIPEHQGQELPVFVQSAGDPFFIPQQFAISTFGFKGIIFQQFPAEIAQIEVRNGFRQRSSGSFKQRHHSPLHVDWCEDPPL